VHLEQPLAVAVGRFVAPGLLGLRQRDAEASRQLPHGIGEADLVEELDELEDIAAHAAPEAVEETLVGVDVERWSLLAVKRAETFPRRAGLLEGDAVLHDLQDVRLHFQVVDERLRKKGHSDR
jgi:hypothetical protein